LDRSVRGKWNNSRLPQYRSHLWALFPSSLRQSLPCTIDRRNFQAHEYYYGGMASRGLVGLGACIQYEDINYAASLSFVAVGTNNANNGMSGVSFLNNADVIEDFAHRAMHVGVVVGKEISKAFHRAEHKKSYYLGCSTGGRPGLKEEQTFAEDFDGIVAGAPAISFNNLTSWSCHFLPLTGAPGDAKFVPMEMWPVIYQDILNQCDALDGLVDGILESPNPCNYNPDGLACGASSANNTSCFTPTQLGTVRSIYSPLLQTDGRLVYPRMQPGADLTGTPQTYFTGQPFGTADWFKYTVFNDSNWDPTNLTPAGYLTSSNLNLSISRSSTEIHRPSKTRAENSYTTTDCKTGLFPATTQHATTSMYHKPWDWAQLNWRSSTASSASLE
jgi:feruloyl esterase